MMSLRSPFFVCLALVVCLGTSKVAGQATCQGVYQFVGSHTACLAPSQSALQSGVSVTDQLLIVNKHNMLRGGVIPTASNMISMVWNNEVAMIAQKWADQCSQDHDAGFDRHVPGRFAYVGQNIAWGSSSWDATIQLWYDEVQDFQYGADTQRGETGHYTQVVWATSAAIGCGYTNCNGLPYYVCNYAPGGNLRLSTSAPYALGTPCQSCPGRCVNNACVCDKVCYNGGTLNLETCECTCTAAFYEPEDCRLACTQATTDQQPGYCTSFYTYQNCREFSNVPADCPIRCGACQAGGLIETVVTTTTAATTTVTPLLGTCHPAYSAIRADHTACLASSPALLTEGVSQSNMNFIVNFHNFMRSSAQIEPDASNMLAIAWDDELAKVAQRWANTCPDSNDDIEARRIPGVYAEVGQNTAWDIDSWVNTMQGWFDESDNFVYGGTADQQNGETRHYTQVVWADSYRIGCGYAECTGTAYSRVYICNYAPAGNTQDVSRPYDLGTPCLNCAGSCNDGVCSCNKVCYNGGVLDSATCTCQCLYNYYNPEDCSLDCSNVANIVESASCNTIFPPSTCSQFPNVPKECPIMCGGCVGGGILQNVVVTTPATTVATTAPVTCPPRYAAIVDHSRCLAEGSRDADLRLLATGLSQGEIDSTVSYHTFRRGNVNPQASDMRVLHWDDEIALVAQGWASTCPRASDLPAARIIPGVFPSVGQNMWFGDSRSSWAQVLETWFAQSNNFVYGATTQPGRVDEYVQMVSAEAYRIGCGFAACEDINTGVVRGVYVCNYAPETTSIAQFEPYELGTPCTDCGGTCVQRACDCGDFVCENGGTRTPQCTCECVMPYHDPSRNCTVNCELAVEDTGCGETLLEAGCEFLVAQRRCPYMCGICTATTQTEPPTTLFPEPECGCPSVHVTAPGVFRDSVGIYTVQPCQVADRPVYMRPSLTTGDRYLYFDEAEGAWVVRTALEGGDTIFRAASSEHRPYYVSAPWEFRQNNDFFLSDRIDVECMCRTPVCQEFELVTDVASYRFPGTFVRQGDFNSRPWYQMEFRSQRALLYFHQAADCSFWKVGSDPTMTGVMMSYDVSAQPGDIKAAWMVAGANNIWTEDSSLEFRCLRY